MSPRLPIGRRLAHFRRRAAGAWTTPTRSDLLTVLWPVGTYLAGLTIGAQFL
ncbi:hypothetical protein ACI8AC_14015 [Geodermatophilus sp. SYSU D00758]